MGGTFHPGGHSGDPGRRVVLRFLGWPSVGQLCIDSRSHPGLSDQPEGCFRIGLKPGGKSDGWPLMNLFAIMVTGFFSRFD